MPDLTESQLDRIESKIDSLYTTLHGEPGEEKKGVIIRLDRLEQESGRRGWWAGAAIVASLGAVAGTAMKWLHSGPPNSGSHP